MALSDPVLIAQQAITTATVGPATQPVNTLAATGATDVLLAAVMIHGASPPDSAVMSGGGLTWTKIRTATYSGSGNHRLTLFTATGAMSSGTTLNYGPGGTFSTTGSDLMVLAVPGGAEPVANDTASAAAATDPISVSTSGITPAVGTSDLVVLFGIIADTTAYSSGTGTEIIDNTHTLPSCRSGAYWDRTSAANPMTMTNGVSATWVGIAVRVTEAPTGDVSHSVPLQTVAVSDLNPVATGGANHAVGLKTVAVTDFDPVFTGGANHAVPLKTVGASALPVAVAAGGGHTVPLLSVSTGLLTLSAATGANFGVPLQAVNVVPQAIFVDTGSGDVAHALSLLQVHLGMQSVIPALGARFNVPLQEASLTQFPNTVQTGADVVVPFQIIDIDTFAGAVTTGAGHAVPLQSVVLELYDVLTETTAANHDVPLLVIRLAQNNGEPMAMYLVRRNYGIVTRERYRFPLR